MVVGLRRGHRSGPLQWVDDDRLRCMVGGGVAPTGDGDGPVPGVIVETEPLMKPAMAITDKTTRIFFICAPSVEAPSKNVSNEIVAQYHNLCIFVLRGP